MSTLGDCLFGTVKLSKNSGLDKHGYSGYGIGFDVCSQFHWMVNGVKTLLFLVHTIVHYCMLMTEKRYLSS